jgi:nicotinamidase-related amidase
MKTDLTQTISLANIKGGAPEAFVQIPRPQNTAAIIVDMQGEPRQLESEPIKSVTACCVQLLHATRKLNMPIIHVHLGTWSDNYRELSQDKKYYTALAQRRAVTLPRNINHPDRQPLPGMEPLPGEIVQQKTSAGAFATTGLAGLLHNLQVTDLVMAGKLTHGCLGMTAIEAVNWGYIVTLIDDASTGLDCVEGHLAILRLFDQFMGRVRSTDEIIAELNPAP